MQRVYMNTFHYNVRKEQNTPGYVIIIQREVVKPLNNKSQTLALFSMQIC